MTEWPKAEGFAAAVTLALVLAATTALPPAVAAEPYLGDLLKQPTYRQAWTAMLESGEEVPGWVIAFSRTRNGVDNPTRIVSVGGFRFRLAELCRPHACDNKLFTLFRPDGRQAWALAVTNGRSMWIGKPDAAIRHAILSAREE